MSINKKKLAEHLEDYFKVTKQKKEKFVCPITLHECDERDLINGHILNEAIQSASRRRVIQYGPIDHFYGSRVEPGLVDFLNLRNKTDMDLLKESNKLDVILPNGSKAIAFWAESAAARNAEGRLPLIDLVRDGKKIISVYLKMISGDITFDGQLEIGVTKPFAPYDWIAALLKVGHLALFDLIGYRAIFDPYGDTIRRSLNQFYQDRAPREEAKNYFLDFQDAVKVITNRSIDGQIQDPCPAVPFDTLNDRIVLLHFTSHRVMFAATCIFKVNDVTLTVTLPQSYPDADPALVLDWYKHCTAHPKSHPQSIHRSRYEGNKWLTEEKPMTYGVLPQ